MSKNALIVAYHFPPIQGSSGVHRTLAFAKFLPMSGWRAAILTVKARVYERVRADNLKLVPDDIRVVRAFALDTKRHLSLAGRYPRYLALPDRWQSWIAGGVLRGLMLVRELRPDALISTYPIASAHVIGYVLHRLTGLPWIADFRDPMLQPGYPYNSSERRAFAWVERRVFSSAAAITVTTPGCREFYLRRYPALERGKVRVIPNGYDEDAFSPPDGEQRPPGGSRPLTLLHSGVLYPNDRNPDCFLRAIMELKQEGQIDHADLEVIFRASGNEEEYRQRIHDYGLGGMIRLEPPVSYTAALDEMLGADGLLIFQSAGCNHQIPAKVYEYLYARKPILGLTDAEGDTGRLLIGLGIRDIAALDDTAAIKAALFKFIQALRAGSFQLPGKPDVEKLSRRSRAADMAGLLDEVASEWPRVHGLRPGS